MRGSDVVVIGGGINGTAITYHLARRGVGVTLLEKGALAGGPTGRSCGIVRQHYSHETTAAMALRALEIFENFDDVVGGHCDFRQTGFVLAVPEERADGLRENVRLQQSVGIDTQLVEQEDLAELLPGHDLTDMALAAWEPRSGYADAYATTVSYAMRATELGARIRTGVPVTRIRVAGNRVRGVDTASGERLHSGAVVLAGGPWSRSLALLCGVDLPILPSRVQVCLFEPATGFEPSCVFIDSSNGIYSRPEGGPLLLVGSIETREGEGGVVDPDVYDESVDLERVEHYTERLLRRIPAMDRGRYRNGYASLYDVTPDWQPILDAVPNIEGLFCAAGSSGHGFKLAPVVGEMMADLVTGARQPEPLFALSRFVAGAPVPGRYPEHKILG